MHVHQILDAASDIDAGALLTDRHVPPAAQRLGDEEEVDDPAPDGWRAGWPGTRGSGGRMSASSWRLVSSTQTTECVGSHGRWYTVSTSSMRPTNTGSAVGARYHCSFSHGLSWFF